MNIKDHHKQNLVDMSQMLTEIAECKETQPSVVQWAQKKRDLERIVIFLNQLIIPELTDPEPGYKPGNGHHQATYTPRPEPLTEAEPKVSEVFAAPPRP